MKRRFPAQVWILALTAACGPRSDGFEEPDVVNGGQPEVSEARAAVSPASPSDTDAPAIVFLGTSLTAGYGLDDPDLAFPGLLAERVQQAGLPFRVVNAGVSGDTSAGGLARLEWLLRSPIAVLVIELGANDGLRGQDPEALQANLRQIVRRTREAYPDVRVVLAGMEAPPNLGEVYTARFRAVFPEVAAEVGAGLIPFLLEGVARVDSLNQGDGIHPNEAGARVVADNVWAVLEGVLLEGG